LTQQRLAFPISISNNQIKKKMHTLIQTPTQQHFFIQHKLSVQHIQKLSFKKLFEASGEKKKKKKSKAKEKKGANHLIVEDCPICFSAKHQHEHEHDIMSLVFIGQFR